MTQLRVRLWCTLRILDKEFKIVRADFEGKKKATASLDIEDGFLVFSGSQLPPLVRVVSAAGLKEGHLRKAAGCEFKLS